MRDMNAKVGSTAYTNVVGKFGLGDINERGERLILFCEQNNLMRCEPMRAQSNLRQY